jgi:hypothetical protein
MGDSLPEVALIGPVEDVPQQLQRIARASLPMALQVIERLVQRLGTMGMFRVVLS